jgi:hypothetical protein
MEGTNDFLSGADIFKAAGAQRYMANPPQDGKSIGHASNYVGPSPGMMGMGSLVDAMRFSGSLRQRLLQSRSGFFFESWESIGAGRICLPARTNADAAMVGRAIVRCPRSADLCRARAPRLRAARTGASACCGATEIVCSKTARAP